MLITVFIFLLFSPVPTFSLRRRILHQPFFPSDSIPPSESPPPPPNPKYPFSNSGSNPNESPFFPSYPPPPPVPPSPFDSFPANISSLVLPHSSHSTSSSSKLVGVTIAAVVAAVVIVAVAAFFFCRKRNREFSDDKTSRSGTSHRLFPINGDPLPVNETPKVRTTSTSNSSEFLYLGTLANPRGIDNRAVNRNNGGSGSGGGSLDSSKLDSPELRPLPPLNSPSFRQSWRKGDVNSNGEETEEEFYSPRVSLNGQESFNGAGSESRRVETTVMAAKKLDEKSSESSSFSYSSSSTNSPARSHSISLSPPISFSPKRFPLKSLESVGIQAAQSPERDLEKDDNNDDDDASARNSNVLFPIRSPSLSPACLSLDKGLKKNPDVSLSMWNVSDRNGDSFLSSLTSSPPLGRIPIASPRISNVPDQIMQDLSLSSPDKDLKKFSVASADQSKHSSLVSSLSSSPDRGFGKIPDESPRVSDVSNQTSLSPSPERVLEKTPNVSPRISSSDRNIESPVRISKAVLRPVSVPPPPPPPPLPSHIMGETPIHSIPTYHQPIVKPPGLIPPSRPSLVQSPTKVSPIQMPSSSETTYKIEETPKPKLKPLHWDKVRASSDREMVWDQLRSSSFKLNEEMIETLFIVNAPKPKEITPRAVLPSPNQENRVLDPKKSQNIAISLRALNVTIEEVCDALLEGNVDALGTELLESLLKMAPTKEEERKLKEYKDDSPIKLGPAEKFLKAVLDIPFAFKRVDAMLYIANFESEIEYLKKSFDTLEAACEELRNSRMFLKLLQAVLKTGNRMNVGTNRGDAHAFKLDTLLKLVDVKGADGKTTLLHFVVQEIIRSEGARLSDFNQAPSSTLSEDAKCRKLGLQVVFGISSELENVKKAATMDSDVLSNDVSKLSRGIGNITEVVKSTETTSFRESSEKFSESMNRFMRMAEENIIKIQAQESVAISLVKEITEYFHGNSVKEEPHPFRIFMVVRDFLAILDRVCKEVGMINDRTIVSSAHKFPVPVNPMLPVPVLPVFPGRQQYNSSDDETASL